MRRNTVKQSTPLIKGCVHSELKWLTPICYSSERTNNIVLASSVLNVIGPDEQTRIYEAHKYTTTQAQKFTTKMHVSQWRSLAEMSGGQHAAGTVSNTQIRNQESTEIHNKNIYKYKHACLRMKVIGPDERGTTGSWQRANESFRCQSEPSRRGISSAFFFYIFAIIWSSVPFLLYPFPLYVTPVPIFLFFAIIWSPVPFLFHLFPLFRFLALFDLPCPPFFVSRECSWQDVISDHIPKEYYCGNYVERAYMFYHEHLL